jgi:hypothetical protein
MTAHIPPTEHKEIDFLDQIERELIALTTADLEGVSEDTVNAVLAPVAPMSPMSPISPILATTHVIPAKAGTHTTLDVPDDNEIAATQRGDGPPPSRG